MLGIWLQHVNLKEKLKLWNNFSCWIQSQIGVTINLHIKIFYETQTEHRETLQDCNFQPRSKKLYGQKLSVLEGQHLIWGIYVQYEHASTGTSNTTIKAVKCISRKTKKSLFYTILILGRHLSIYSTL